MILIPFVATAGLTLLYLLWKNKTQSKVRRVLTSLASCLLIVFAIQQTTNAYGVEYGLCYALLGLSTMALLICVFNIDFREKKVRSDLVNIPFTLDAKKIMGNVSNFVIVVPVMMLFSMIITLLISQSFSWETVNQLTFVIIVGPLFWASTSYLYLLFERRIMLGAIITIATITTTFLTFT